MTRFLFAFLFAAAIAPFVLAGCSGWQAQSDYDPTVDFSLYRTWDWLPEPPEKEETGEPKDELTHARIRNAIEQHLAKKGYKRSEGAADFLVVYHGGIKDTMTMTQTTDAYKDFPYSEFDWSYAYTYEWRKGHLEIDIIDAKTRQLAWKGSLEAEVKPTADPEKKTERLTRAVDTILGEFPPGR